MMDSNITTDLMSKQIVELNSKKEKLIFERIHERVKTGEPISLDEESKRMFPRIKMIQHNIDQSEHYYWNDGSIEGLHLISFYPNINHDFQNDKFNITLSLNYR